MFLTKHVKEILDETGPSSVFTGTVFRQVVQKLTKEVRDFTNTPYTVSVV
jgi:hypothetical protein